MQPLPKSPQVSHPVAPPAPEEPELALDDSEPPAPLLDVLLPLLEDEPPEVVPPVPELEPSPPVGELELLHPRKTKSVPTSAGERGDPDIISKRSL